MRRDVGYTVGVDPIVEGHRRDVRAGYFAERHGAHHLSKAISDNQDEAFAKFRHRKRTDEIDGDVFERAESGEQLEELLRFRKGTVMLGA